MNYNSTPIPNQARGVEIRADELTRTREVVNRIRTIRGGPGIDVRQSSHGTVVSLTDSGRGNIASRFLAKLTGHATLASSGSIIYQWAYAWEEVGLDGDADFADGFTRSGTTTTDYALNLIELNHDATYVWGVDVTHADYPDNFAPRAVGGGGTADTHRLDIVVEMTQRTDKNGATKYTFSAQGSHDGAC